MLKVDFHTHTEDDPADRIPHSATQLLERASSFGFDAIGISLHDQQYDYSPVAAMARELGLTLLPGIERTISGRHVLMVNFPGDARVSSFEELADLKRRHPPGLVIAPHPFFPLSNCLRELLELHGHLFDAVEYNGAYSSLVNYNTRAVHWATEHGKPVVGCSDAHRLRVLGLTYSLVDAPRNTAEEICAAVKRGAVQLRTAPLTIVGLATYLASMALAGHRPAPVASREPSLGGDAAGQKRMKARERGLTGPGA